MKICIKTFRLIGISKNYEVNFKKGLNFISGPTSTGKSAILELIDYALGAKNHKSYIEIRQKCTDVEVELYIYDTLYLIRRKLFSSNLPITVEVFDEKSSKFVVEGIYYTENKESNYLFSDFLLSKLGLEGLVIANQRFSFRDLFKYSYLKQTEIDSEDLFDGETNYVCNIKRKSTFEIIFNVFDNLLSEQKKLLKMQKDQFKNEQIKYDGISDFLDKANIKNVFDIETKKNEIYEQIEKLKAELSSIRLKSNDEINKSYVEELRKQIAILKDDLKVNCEQLNDQTQYINKLLLLNNQYESEINKINALKVGINEINKFDYILCPNCLKPLSEHHFQNRCSLCGNEMDNVEENLSLLNAEQRNITRKRSELIKHIDVQKNKKDALVQKINQDEEILKSQSKILNELTENSISPYVDEISLINQRIGKNRKEIDELENSKKFIDELNRLSILLAQKGKDIENLEKQIKSKERLGDKKTLIKSVSNKFEDILEEFKFPKLDSAYFHPDNYLPFVRNVKYNSIGSLGAVTLITMAYYLSIFLEAKDDEYNHLNLLIIDTPRKNLGSSSTEKDFQDDEIYHSIIRYFMKLCNENDDVQLIIVNNGYPEFLPKEDVVIEFSPDGKVGLIDDI